MVVELDRTRSIHHPIQISIQFELISTRPCVWSRSGSRKRYCATAIPNIGRSISIACCFIECMWSSSTIRFFLLLLLSSTRGVMMIDGVRAVGVKNRILQLISRLKATFLHAICNYSRRGRFDDFQWRSISVALGHNMKKEKTLRIIKSVWIFRKNIQKWPTPAQEWSIVKF